MKNFEKIILSTFVMASIALTAGCAREASSADVSKALSQAVKAELHQGQTVESLPIHKSIATNFDEGRQFLIARKVGNVAGKSECALFDITVSRPTSQFALLGKGDSTWKQNVKICTP